MAHTLYLIYQQSIFLIDQLKMIDLYYKTSQSTSLVETSVPSSLRDTDYQSQRKEPALFVVRAQPCAHGDLQLFRVQHPNSATKSTRGGFYLVSTKHGRTDAQISTDSPTLTW